ncbi:hypothetical protein [Paenibacillus odorifer]|uniref:hypothetical protein n=1 Tax=Paenibacillus odorifer TaxID=189426 RepID=UPI0015C3F64E|nr:hypothetical protein [Paenibacillus odorifer]
MMNLTDEEITIIHGVLLEKINKLADSLVCAEEHEVESISKEVIRIQEITGKLIR